MGLIVPDSSLHFLKQQRTGYGGAYANCYTEDLRQLFRTIRPYLGSKIKTVLDIGAGLGGINVYLSETFPDAKFWLLDKQGDTGSKIGWHESMEDFGSYNSFNETKKFLTANGVSPNRYILTEEFPKVDFDLIMSSLSWGFHYPVSSYIDNVMMHLKEDGILIMDIRIGTNGISDLKKYFTHLKVISDHKKHAKVLCVR